VMCTTYCITAGQSAYWDPFHFRKYIFCGYTIPLTPVFNDDRSPFPPRPTAFPAVHRAVHRAVDKAVDNFDKKNRAS